MFTIIYRGNFAVSLLISRYINVYFMLSWKMLLLLNHRQQKYNIALAGNKKEVIFEIV